MCISKDNKSRQLFKAQYVRVGGIKEYGANVLHVDAAPNVS